MDSPVTGPHAESRARRAETLVGDLRRLDPRQAASLVQVYSLRATCDDAARALNLTLEDFLTTLSSALRDLGRLVAAGEPHGV